jgi:hypothetical protein
VARVHRLYLRRKRPRGDRRGRLYPRRVAASALATLARWARRGGGIDGGAAASYALLDRPPRRAAGGHDVGQTTGGVGVRPLAPTLHPPHERRDRARVEGAAQAGRGLRAAVERDDGWVVEGRHAERRLERRLRATFRPDDRRHLLLLGGDSAQQPQLAVAGSSGGVDQWREEGEHAEPQRAAAAGTAADGFRHCTTAGGAAPAQTGRAGCRPLH